MDVLRRVVKRLVIGGVVITGGTAGLVVYKVSRSKWSDSHDWSSAIKHYLTNQLMVGLGNVSYRQLLKNSRNVRQVQEEFLLSQIRKNQDTEYGRDHSFPDIVSVDDFRRLHPLTRYPHYRSYVQKIVETGDLGVMTKDPPAMLAVTSGTSGKSSLYPTTVDIFKIFFLSGIAVLFHCLNVERPEWVNLQRSMKLFFTPKWRETDFGMKIGPNSSNPDSSRQIFHLYVTPPPAYKLTSEPELLYIHLLFGTMDRNLGIIESNFANLVFTGFKTLEARWQDIADDIEAGRISEKLDIDPDLRADINSRMRPNPERAAELRREFSKGFDDIARRIWPNLNLILTTSTGAMKIYGEQLKATYCRSVPQYSPLYGASEGLIGVNLAPFQDDAYYCLVPNAQFFEFIPIDHSSDDQPETLLATEVEKGKGYELVISNPSGLYRYRLGDVVRIHHHFNELPVVEFRYRVGQMLNVRGEKVSEESFYRALCNTNAGVADYACAESVVLSEGSSAVPHYVVFVEGKEGGEEFAAQLDRELCDVHPVYKSFRVKGSIDRLKVVQVKEGAFGGFRDYLIANSDASRNQLKIPRKVMTPGAAAFLQSQVV